MKRLWWVRHGPTHARGMVGWSDLPADLSDQDRIARLAAFLPDAAVVSSDLGRAIATADAIGGDRPRLPHDAGLREINFGAWEMRDFAEVEAEDPARIRGFWEDPGLVRPPDGESWDEVAARVSSAADRLIDAHKSLILVAHMGAIMTQLQRALAIPAVEAFSYRIEPLSVTCLTFEDGWRVERVNHCP
jgi:broad specificity phosphatase PhoE